MANEFIPAQIPLQGRTVGQILADRASTMGDKAFVVTTDGDEFSYRELHRRSSQFARGAEQLGIEFQEPVLVMLPDTVDFLTVWCGLGKRGAIEVPINTAYRKSILKRLCNDSSASKIIIDVQFVDRLEEIAEGLENLNLVIAYSETQALPVLPPKLAERCQLCHFDDLISDDDSPYENQANFHDLVAIMYTSGTTGASKGVAVTHSHSYCYADSAGEIFSLCPEDRYYTSGLPLFHVGCQWATCYASMIYGATVVLRRGYKNEYFWPDIAEHQCTVVFLLGAIANFIWQQPPQADEHLTPLKKIGMFPVIPEHEAFCKRFSLEISTGYGSTETPCPLIHHFGEPFPNNQCVGFPTAHYEVTIKDEADRDCAPGQMGEICVRPKRPWEIMLQYWRQPAYTAEAFRNLWYHTGDAGYRDEQGRFYFVDRLTDSMRRRGENISSMEVEGEINQHPDVLECAVFPVWDEHTEQEVMTVVTPRSGVEIDPVQLIEFLDQRLAYFMVPRYVEFSDEIPKTPTGKMEKYKLRERGVTDLTWDRVAAGVRLSR